MTREISRRLMGASAVSSPTGEVIGVDVDGLIQRALLFEKYVLMSIRLKEFPILARQLGYEALRDLLSANLMEIRCDCFQLTQTAQSGLFGDPVLPAFSYQFHWIKSNDESKYVHDCLQEMHTVAGLRHKDLLRLKRAIAESINPLPVATMCPKLFKAFQYELLYNPELIRKSIEIEIHNKLGYDGVPFSLALHQDSEETFRVETNLADNLKVDREDAHRIVEAGIMGVAGLTQTIGEMREYSALSGFRDEELPLFRHKLDFLFNLVSSEAQERNFQRVLDIAGVPQLSSRDGTINVERLIKVRESRELREFRDWLSGIGAATDTEISENVAGLRNFLGLKVGSEIGKTIRSLVTFAAGFCPKVGIPLGIFDQFVLDRILPRSGIAAFINELYPSVFKGQE
jgi:hypothetical protein